MSLGCCVSLVSGTILVGPTCRPGGPWGRRRLRLQESGRPASHQIFFSPLPLPACCLPASVSLPASQARPRPTPAMALASGTLLGRPAGTARPHLAVSSSSASSIRFPRGGGGGRAVSLRGSSPPGTWSTQMSFLLLPRDWNR
jgi:hypothetical protein